MNNSVCSKTMRNSRNRVYVRLFVDSKGYKDLVSKPSFVSKKILNKNVIAAPKTNEVLTLDKLAYVGTCILDLTKSLMHEFHHKYVKEKYAKVLFTDADHLTYEIKTNGV